jgi:hypothetical protein
MAARSTEAKDNPFGEYFPEGTRVTTDATLQECRKLFLSGVVSDKLLSQASPAALREILFLECLGNGIGSRAEKANAAARRLLFARHGSIRARLCLVLQEILPRGSGGLYDCLSDTNEAQRLNSYAHNAMNVACELK